MRIVKKIVLVVLILFALLQFIPRNVNKSNEVLATDITRNYAVPSQVLTILKKACYDCHSNNTSYPWYAKVQPFRLMLDRHVKNGKKELNFSEYGGYTAKRQYNKFMSIGESIEDGSMPLKSYRWMHSGARLTQEEKAKMLKWVEDTRDSIRNRKDK